MIDLKLRSDLGTFQLDVEVTAPAGITAVFGPSGSGKTCIINSVSGILKPDTGHVKIGSKTLFDGASGVNIPVHKRRIGYVFQDARLFPHMNVSKNLRYGGDMDAERVIPMLGLEGLLDRYPATLSGGERQRVALGRALLSAPRLLLMDEPLSALDDQRKLEILPYIERLRDELQLPILYVTHAISEVARLANTMVILDQGHVKRVGPVGQVLADPSAVPLVGVRQAGAVITARVVAYDKANDLTLLQSSNGSLVLPGQLGPMAHPIRVRIPAQDVILSDRKPQGLSALNILACRVTEISVGKGPGVAVGLHSGQDALLARITRKSADALQLEPGKEVFAILKATAVAPSDVGHG